MLDMTACQYDQESAYTVRVSNAAFLPSEGEIRVRLEGAGKIGERFVSIVAIRDLSILEHLDPIIDWTRQQVEQRFTGKSYQLSYRVYNNNGITDDHDAVHIRIPNEACVVVEGIAETEQLAEELTMMGAQLLAYAPSITEKAGRALPTLAFDGLLSAPPAYQWTINHSLTVEDPLELFKLYMLTVE